LAVHAFDVLFSTRDELSASFVLHSAVTGYFERILMNWIFVAASSLPEWH
jgi:hypothetical protein